MKIKLISALFLFFLIFNNIALAETGGGGGYTKEIVYNVSNVLATVQDVPEIIGFKVTTILLIVMSLSVILLGFTNIKKVIKESIKEVKKDMDKTKEDEDKAKETKLIR